MKGWSIVAALLLSLALVSSIACNPLGQNKPSVTQELVEVKRGDLTITVSGSGNIEISRDLKLVFGVGGRVAKIYVAENDEVSQGAVLARLETDALELALTQAKVAYTQAKVTVAESEGAVTRAEVAVTQAQAAVTESGVTIARAEAAVTQAQAAVTESGVTIARAEAAVIQAQAAATESAVTIARAEAVVTQAQAAYTQAQATLQSAEYERDKAQKTYTLSDIKVAQSEIDVAKTDLEEALEKVTKYEPGSEGELFWQKVVIQVQTRLKAAEDRLAVMLSGSDTAEVAIKKRQVETAQQSLEAAGQSLETAKQSLELAKLSPELTRQSLEAAKQSLELAKLSPELTRQSLEAAKQSLELAKLSPALARQSLESAKQSLELTKLSPEVARQSLELTWQSLEQAQKQLDRATLVAPFAGVVARLYDVAEGDTISTATTILYLIDPSRMELQVQVDEVDIPEVKLGQRAIVEVDALPALRLEGKVSSMSRLPTVEASVITYGVKIDLALPEGVGLRASMSASADIVVNERSQVLLVPNRAISQDRQGQPVVAVMVNGQTEQKAIVIGISDGSQTEIIQGLNEGETVVIEKKVKP